MRKGIGFVFDLRTSSGELVDVAAAPGLPNPINKRLNTKDVSYI